MASQAGQVGLHKLRDYLEVNGRLAAENGITSWSIVESFDRDMPIKFLPIAWLKMQYKMESALESGVDKLITFEFSHFMSPQSIYHAAHLLSRTQVITVSLLTTRTNTKRSLIFTKPQGHLAFGDQ